MDKKPSIISVTLIVKNEIRQLEKCLLSFKDHVDEIVIVDTGSTDGSQEVAKKYAHKFEQFSDCNDPETGLIQDFAMARNRALSLATGDYVLWVDADDEIEGAENLRKIIDSGEATPPEGQAVYVSFPYEYAYDENGNPIVRQYRERIIHPRKDFHWLGSVHEVLNPDNPQTYNIVSDLVVFKHRRGDKFIEPRRNLNILKAQYARDGESDARLLYYLGLEYGNVGENDAMIKMLTRYIELSGWDDEKFFAMMRIYQYYLAIGDYEKAIEWALRASVTKESWGESYFGLCKCYYYLAQAGKDERRNWERAVHFGKTGLALPETRTLLFLNPMDRKHDIYVYLNVAQSKIGDVEGALESCMKGLEAKPDSEFLLANKKVFEDTMKKHNLEKELLVIKEKGFLTDEEIKTVVAALEGRVREAVAGDFPAYEKPAEYPHGLTDEHFPVAKKAPHKNAWVLPEIWEIDSLPVKMTDAQLQATALMIWKEFIQEDEVLSAISFLEKVPYRIRHTPATEEALKITRKMIAWLDNLSIIQDENSTPNTLQEQETGVPLPGELTGQTKERFDLVMDQLRKYKAEAKQSIVDFGCFDGLMTNRYGLAGYDVLGIDLTEKAVNVANAGAEKFKTGARHIVSHFDASAEVVPHEAFDFATSNESYEHLRNPVEEMIKPAMKMLKPDGKFFMGCPYGSIFRGNYVSWSHLWERARKENTSWLAPPRAHLVAPTPWTAAKDFSDAGMWVRNSYAHIFETAWVPNQGSVVLEAHMQAPTNDNPLDIVFWVGNGLEHWTPKTVEKTGIGGSELMAMEMAKRLALLGHRVRMYVGCGQHGEGIYDGVEYLQTEKYQDLNCDVLIVSRWANMLDDQYKVEAKLRLLWVHDIFALNGQHQWLLKADKILALSEWHKENLIKTHDLHPDHVLVTRNGIDLDRFTENPERNQFKIVNSSSPDRGWATLLGCWEDIKKEVPEAELHLFYGFKNWELGTAGNVEQQKIIQSYKDAVARLKDRGVIFRDRVSHKQLAHEMLSAGVWAYGTNFTETSCISAMEAQAAGLEIVCSSIAALAETVGNRGTLLEGDCSKPEFKKQFIEQVVLALKNPNGSRREKTKKFANDYFGLEDLSKNWSDMLYRLLESKDDSLVIPYQPTESFAA